MAPKRKYREYSDEDMNKALEAVNDGTTINKASKTFGVPKQTISDRINKKYKTMNPGRRKDLSDEQEEALIYYIKYMESIAYPLSVPAIKNFAWVLSKRNGKSRFNPVTGPGHTWWDHFKNRHRNELTLRKSGKLDRGRSRTTSQTVIKQHFDLLEKTLNDLNIKDKPKRIFNCNESGITLDVQAGKVVVERKATQTYSESKGTSEHVTAHITVSAAGLALPPFLIFEKCYPSGPYSRLGPDNALYGISVNGYMNSELFRKWVDKLFIPKTSHIQRPILLILDGHGSHLDKEIIDKLVKNQIHLFCLPPHTTNILQPLDMAIFRPLKAYFSKVAGMVKMVTSGTGEPLRVCKKNFTPIFNEAYNSKFNAAIIKVGFKKCGIYPFNPDAINKKAVMDMKKANKNESKKKKKKTASVDALPQKKRKIIKQSKCDDIESESEESSSSEEDDSDEDDSDDDNSDDSDDNDSDDNDNDDGDNDNENTYAPETHCFKCHRQNPPTSSKQICHKNVVWISCDNCSNWFHDVCESATHEDLSKETYICRSCSIY